MIKNYSLKDAFRALEDLNEDFIETSIVVSGPLTEDIEETVIEKEDLTEKIFSLSDEESLKDIEEFKEEGEKEQPEIKIVDTNANDIDEVASNKEVAGSFVFTCDKCGQNIFRTLDDLRDAGYEKLDDSERSQFKLKNKNISDGEFYCCARCGGDIWNGDKQIVLADVDKEVTGEEEIATEPETEVDVTPEEPSRDVEVSEINKEEVALESLKEEKEPVKEGFKKIVNGQTFWSVDGEEWEECTREEYDECGYEEVNESLVEEEQKESGDEEAKESGEETFEDKMNFLAKDEQEAIDGYNKIIPEVEDEHIKDQLEKITTEEEAHKEYLEKVQEDPTIDYVEPLESGEEESEVEEDEYDDLAITDIDEISIDEAISSKLKEIYENFGSYKTTTALLNDEESKIYLEGKLTFTSNKEQPVKFILEGIESDNGNIKFKLTCEQFEDISSEIITSLNEGLLEAKEFKKLNEEAEDIEKKIKSGDSAIEFELNDGSDISYFYIFFSEKLNKYIAYVSIYHASEDNNGDNPETHTDEEEHRSSSDNLEEFINELAEIYGDEVKELALKECLTEASSAEKKAFKDGGDAYSDLIRGKAIARIKDKKARDAAIAAIKAGRSEVASEFTGDRKENQAERSAEKKFAKMQKAGLKESDDEWKDPAKCDTLEEYDDEACSYIENRHQELLDPREISDNEEQDYTDYADHYITDKCSQAIWGSLTSNPDEKRLILEYISRNFPIDLKVLRKYLGNSKSSIKLDQVIESK